MFLLFVHSGLNAEPENLSINLMWLNANKTQSITDGVRPDPKQVVKSWFLKHPENNTVVNFWYDGSKIGLDKATIVERERNAFLNVLSDDEKQRFNLRDMQELDLVKECRFIRGDSSLFSVGPFEIFHSQRAY